MDWSDQETWQDFAHRLAAAADLCLKPHRHGVRLVGDLPEAGAADGDLLDAQHLERSRVAHAGPHSNSRMIWSTARLSPLPAETVFTTASRWAMSTFSIFIASMTASRSPARTC